MCECVQEIWNIFTFYTLHGNPLDPEHLRVRYIEVAGVADSFAWRVHCVGGGAWAMRVCIGIGVS